MSRHPQPKGWGNLCFVATAVFSESPPSYCHSLQRDHKITEFSLGKKPCNKQVLSLCVYTFPINTHFKKIAPHKHLPLNLGM